MAIAALTAGCGGGGSGSTASPTATPTTPDTPSTTRYAVNGSVTGTVGPGLVLQLNNGDDLAVDVDRAFSFPPTLSSGTPYRVTVKTNPTGQLCQVTANGEGTAGTAMPAAQVTCTTPTAPGATSYRLGGSISGLTSNGLTLQLGSEVLSVPANTNSFLFSTAQASGSAYSVSIGTQPANPAQTCTLSNASGNVANADITTIGVTCVSPPVAPQNGLSLSAAALNFSAEEGQTVADQILSGAITGATEPVYLTASYTTSGLTYAAFTLTSSTTGQLAITPSRPGDLGPGTYTDTVTVRACFDPACTRPVAGSPRTVPVTYIVTPANPAPRLRLSDRGIAFASIPGATQLTKSVVVQDTSGATSNWTATSSATWLNVTSSGASGGAMVVTANTSGLAPGLHLATATVSSSNTAIPTAETLRVGLYVSNTASATVFTQPLLNSDTSTADSTDAPDPIRPLLYSASGATLASNHIHSGARTDTLTITGAQLGSMVANDDGSRLYVIDYNQLRVVIINLDTFTVQGSFGFPQLLVDAISLRAARLSFARVEGQPVLIINSATQPLGTQGGQRMLTPIIHADTGGLIGEFYGAGGSSYTRLAVSRDGRVAYAAEAGLSGILSTARVALRANSLGNVYGKAVAYSPGITEAGMNDIATNADGSRVVLIYATNMAIREAVFNGTTLTWANSFSAFQLPVNTSANGVSVGNVEYGAYGDLFANFYGYDLRNYNSAGTMTNQWLNLGEVALVTGVSGAMRLSSDGLRVMGNSGLLTLRP